MLSSRTVRPPSPPSLALALAPALLLGVLAGGGLAPPATASAVGPVETSPQSVDADAPIPAAPRAPAPWDEPFTDDVSTVLAAAATPDRAEQGVRVLLEDVSHRYDESGRAVHTRRLVYRLDSPAGVDGWDQVIAAWRPWYQERPEIRARVIEPGGTVRWLDPATVAEVPLEETAPDVLSDSLELRAPLPGVTVGAVVEEQVVTRERVPVFEAGVSASLVVGFSVPSQGTRLVLDAPASLPLAWRTQLLDGREPHREEADGRVRLTFETGPREPLEAGEPFLPGDVPRQPRVAWSTGGSWQDVAAAYAAVVEEQVAGADLAGEVAAALEALPATGAGREADRQAVVQALTTRLHDRVRYTGLEFGEAALVPRSPREVLERGYGDCKDKSALLLALLREAGIPAHLALLRTAPSQDVDPELPGIGAFNHAVVHVPAEGGATAGAEGVWVDATAPHHPAGLLPAGAQGRLALLAVPEGGRLVTTPASGADDNHEVDRRRILLAEIGGARVVDRAELRGLGAADFRANVTLLDDESLDQAMGESFSELWGGGELVDWRIENLDEPQRPLVLHSEVAEVGVARTAVADAAVALSLHSLVEDLPYPLHAAPDEAEPRTHDLLQYQPYSVRLEYTVIPPDGYRLLEVPESADRPFGPARFVRRFEEREDGTLEATLAFHSGPRRYTPEQVEAVRAGVAELVEEGSVVAVFHALGEDHLAAGRVGEALAEFRRLASAHPESALHPTRISRALLAAGLGAAARKAAERAVELEPESALAHQFLGWALLHDPVGRPFAEGWDREGAAEALRRAKELDPDNEVVRRNLAVLLEHDAEGVRYAPGADLDAAVDEYRAYREDLGDPSLDTNLLVALVRARRFEEAEELARELAQDAAVRMHLLAAVAATDGVEAAVREARSVDGEEERRAALAAGGQLLMQLRRYPEAAGLMRRAARGAAGAAGMLGLAERLEGMQRHEEIEVEGDDPPALVRRLFVLLAVGEEEELRSFLETLGDDLAEEEELDEWREARQAMEQGLEPGVSVEMVMDVMLDRLETSPDARVDGAHRVRVGLMGESWYAYFAERDGGDGYRMVAFHEPADLEALAELGVEALQRVEEGEPERARPWLDWARREVLEPRADDPLSGLAFAHLWSEGSEGGATDLRRAAAALAVHGEDDDDVAEAASVLEEERIAAEAAGDTDALLHLDHALAEAYVRQERAEELAELALRLHRTHPESEEAMRLAALGLGESGRLDELEAVSRGWLEEHPDDETGLRQLAWAAELRGDVEEARRRLERLVDLGKGLAEARNQIAWFDAMLGEVDEGSLEIAHEAVERGEDPGSVNAALHTLATVYAELDRPGPALDVLHQAIGQRPQGMVPVDWYVIGRIAESYGETAAAVDAYGRVERPEDEGALPYSTWTLAQRRLEGLQGEGG